MLQDGGTIATAQVSTMVGHAALRIFCSPLYLMRKVLSCVWHCNSAVGQLYG